MSDSQADPSRENNRISSYVWAILITIGIGAWLLTGQIAPAAPENEAPDSSGERPVDQNLFKVSTRIIKAQSRPAQLVIRGQTKSPARVHVRAETQGVVESITDRKGHLVNKGDLLCKLKIDTRQATLTEARSSLAQAQSDYNSSSKLSRSGFTAKNRKMADKARLEAAKAAVARAELDLKRIEVRAPFQGMIAEQPAKLGDYLRQADICATLVKVNPILLTGSIAERDLKKVKIGMSVTGTLVTGESVKGQLTYISPASNTQTKTFTIEATIPNPDRSIRAGVTADILIGLDSEMAHRVAASALSLDGAGQIGLKVVDDADVVRFVPVTILANEKRALWVAGLPEVTNIITVGQEYVLDGQKVRAVPEVAQERGDIIPSPKPAREADQSTETRTTNQPNLPRRKPKA